MAQRLKAPIRTGEEITAMRESGQILANVLQLLRDKSEPDLTPKDMSAMAKAELRRLGGEPAFLGFYGYPDIICISVNDEIQHSIPSSRRFRAGDVVNYDFGVRYKGMITDAGITVCIGGNAFLTPNTKRLIEGTEKALYDGIGQVKAGCRIGDISNAIEGTLRHYRLGIVRELVGHGVGHELHEDPEVPNHGVAGSGPLLRSGMTIAIEPITTLGSPVIRQASDGWTLLTADGSWSAQFEHTVLVTEGGCDILTALNRNLP
ncbi:MAG TPA: type I methionyl aminopeptidase [Candidatus Saccharimonadales bacterium]|nr:type I methionyl aminopeptidase [Candidatus Saccharimonadales bacterium]